MKKYLVILLLTFFSTPVFCQRTRTVTMGNNGIGIMIGSETGINFKHFINQRRGWDAAFSLRKGSNTFYADYLLHTERLLNTANPWFYYGGGALLTTGGNKTVVAARGALGLEFFVVPFDLFLEVAPVFSLMPSTNLDADLEIGVRFFF